MNGGLILWIRDFLSDRPQRVSSNGHVSELSVLNTGAPQGTILSPLLFSVYTNEFRIQDSDFSLFKYADDMALVSLLHEGDTVGKSKYFNHVTSLQNWCQSSALEINIGKTKEMVISTRKNFPDLCQPLKIIGHTVEKVSYFKYLGTYIDSHLTFLENTNYVFKKAMQRLHLLRKLNDFGVSQSILEMVYKNLVESILSFNMVAWYGHLDVKSKGKLMRVVKTASKIIGKPQMPLSDRHVLSTKKKALDITRDPSHPLYKQFEVLPSGRRFRLPRTTKNIYKKSFVPNATRLLNG